MKFLCLELEEDETIDGTCRVTADEELLDRDGKGRHFPAPIRRHRVYERDDHWTRCGRWPG